MSPSSIQSARALVAFETTISLSPHATSNAVTPIELESVVDILRAGDAHGKLTAALAGFTGRDRAKITGFGFQDHIAQIRATYAAAKCRAAGYADPGDVIHAAKEAVSKLKKALPGFLFSGSFSRRAHLSMSPDAFGKEPRDCDLPTLIDAIRRVGDSTEEAFEKNRGGDRPLWQSIG